MGFEWRSVPATATPLAKTDLRLRFPPGCGFVNPKPAFPVSLWGGETV
jgi:hypothetical protein